MEFEWDDNKNRLNVSRRGLNFRDVDSLDWLTADYRLDTRSDYGERRVVATGIFRRWLTVVVFTPRGGRLRIISWRMANQRERKRYGY